MQLFLFNHITQDPVIDALLTFKRKQDDDAYYTAARGLIAFAKNRLTDGNLIHEYVLRTMLEQENLPDIVHLRDFLRHDVKVIYHAFMATDWEALFHEKGLVSLCQIPIQPQSTDQLSYVFSLRSMMDSTSNEALGGAILAHVESFGTEEQPSL